MSTFLFLFRIAVPPVLVALMSLGARRFGPTIGGMLMGLPWMTGPILFFLTLDKGPAFARNAFIGVELAVIGIAAFVVTYGYVSRHANWFFSLLGAMAAFFLTATVLRLLDVSLALASALGVGSLLLAYVLVPKPRGAFMGGRLPAWDIPARMAATFLLVAIIMSGADILGPRLSGILASYPVILTVVGCFTHHQWGRDAVLQVLRGISLSLIGFVLFFAVIASCLEMFGLVPAFALGALVSVAFSGSLIAWRRLAG